MASSVQAFVLAYWMAVPGVTPVQADALVHHAYTETKFEYCAVSPYGDHGLYQWRASRARQLQRFAGTSSCPPLKVQLDYARWELSQYPYSTFWRVPGRYAYSFLRRCFGGGDC